MAIIYPEFNSPVTIGVTAPSSGLYKEQYSLLERAIEKMESKGFTVKVGDTAWMQYKAKSAPATTRAAELNSMLQDDTIDFIFPPWGGELLIEILEHIQFEKIKPKWLLGYSDTSVLLLAITLKTGIATAHGNNIIDLRGRLTDPTTAMWEKVLFTKKGEEVIQYSSEKFQLEWQHNNETDYVFHLTEPTKWKTVKNDPMYVKGRLLGGCIDVIRHLIGTPYGDVRAFQKQFINNEPIIWYLENCELQTTDLRRTLVQMKLAGWFDNCSAILFGRSPANQPKEDYHVVDVYMELAEELGVPIGYDIDCGHMPPQITFVNGAYAEVRIYTNGGMVTQRFIE
ncbi:S66 family peptidase [Ureibacillus acetophenoni]|uniref:Muramoyltetrapeptide carboxypeptidase LdcA involved in peptidoglycan recycling n=1 Tax=Ureibacillus acetophenoni TaxID=614649 RepID=A0A285UP20_9BACL|nr:S66 peptidase family protein [Ureibacillus acetophenoni]SOC42386.1 muramoyltetrapeptide carboxypeptidase LdcA involved in peptidoglycan recycling [Ureibacillus acetophenoni]